MRHVITLPNGRQCSVGRYARAWREILALPPAALCPGFDHFPERADKILREMRRGLDDRINRHDPRYRRGRKWEGDYQVQLWRDSRRLQDIARRVRVYQFETVEARSRFGDRLTGRDE